MTFLLRCALLLCTAALAAGQEPLRLTHLRDVKKLTPRQAEQQRIPVAARVFITAPSRFTLWSVAQQDDAPFRLRFPRQDEMPPPNCEVEINGVTRGSTQDAPAGAMGIEEVHVEVRDWKLVRSDATPEPLRVTPEEVQAVRYPGRWLEFEGTVLQLRRYQGDLHVHLAGDTGWMIFYLRDMPHPVMPEWLGARLRVRGPGAVTVDRLNASLGTYGAMNVEVIQPAPAAPPLSTARALLGAGSTGARALVQATVLQPASRDGQAWLRDSSGTPFVADFLIGFAQNGNEPRTELPGIPRLHAGDPLEVVGSPSVNAGHLRMRYCVMRVTGDSTTPVPRQALLSEAAAGKHRHDLISLRGRPVFQGTITPQPGQRFEVVRLAADGAEVEAYLDNTSAESFPSFGPDDLLEATGIAVAPGAGGADRLMLRSAQDIRSLGLAPEVAQSRQWRNAGIIGGSVFVAATIMLLLRRQVVKERALSDEVRSLNATLESRVTQRTAELEKAREDLKAALNEEREVGEMKSRFVSTVSHEFRTPLGVIMSATDILDSYMDRLSPEKKQEHLMEIRSATRHMSGMMEDVLLLGRAESGRLNLTPFPLDLLDLCQRIANETHSATSQTGTTTITSDPLPGDAVVDEMLLRHMISNLVSNAIKYSPPGSEVKLHIAAEGPDAVITVTDEGIGIPPEDAAKLFQPFARATNVGHRSGTGLGLVVVKRCAELHGGSVSFTGSPGKGTTFTLRIPAWPANS